MQKSKSLLRQDRLKERLGKLKFHYDLEEVFELVTESQKQCQNQTNLESEKQIQTLRDSTQTTTQATQNQTRAIPESRNALNKNFRKSIKEGIQVYDRITNRNH